MKYSKLRDFAKKRAKSLLKNKSFLLEYCSKITNLNIIEISTDGWKKLSIKFSFLKESFAFFFYVNMKEDKSIHFYLQNENGYVISRQGEEEADQTFYGFEKEIFFLLRESYNFFDTPYPWGFINNYIDFLYNFDKNGHLID